MDIMGTWQRLKKRAETNASFREELQADPEGVLARESGMSAAEVREQLKQLDEEELALVSGGNGPLIAYVCPACNGVFLDPGEYRNHPCPGGA